MDKGILLQRVSFAYHKNIAVLSDINYVIAKGDFVGISGINGSGKSTFTYLLNGIIPHQIAGILDGRILVDGRDTQTAKTADIATKVGLVFQNPDLTLFNLTVEEEIAFGLTNLKYPDIGRRVKEALEMVAIKGFEKKDPQSLSVGEKQKVSLAAVLAMDTDYIILDEPTAMLDYKSSVELYKILRELNRRKKTIIVVEHDTDFLWKFSRQIMILDQGRIKTTGNTKEILSKFDLLDSLGIKRPNINF